MRKGTAYHILSRQIQIIRHLILISIDWSADLLAAEVVEAVGEAAETINGWSSWPHDLRQVLHTALLGLVLTVWRAYIRIQTSPPRSAICWPMDSTLHALCIIMCSLKMSQGTSQGLVRPRVPLQLEVLPLLSDFLGRARPETAFLTVQSIVFMITPISNSDGTTC